MSENQTRNTKPLNIAIIVIAVLLLCCCLAAVGLAIGGVLTVPWSVVTNARVEATEKIEKTFDVSTPVSLSVDVNVGDVVIRAGDGNEVRIYAVKHAWGKDRRQAEEYLDDFEVRLHQTMTGDVEIEYETPRRLSRIGRTPSVDLEISVPRDTNLDLVINVGDTEVTGVRGAFEIESNVGDVTLRDVRFEEDSRIKSAVGDIELRLPPDSVFAFSAESNVGDIRVDFDIQNERSDKRVVGESVEGEIGTSPTAHVELHTNTGDIKIRRE
jgi:hypothetical protein